MYESILIATDGSDHTREAISHGLALAEEYGAVVHTVYVVDTRAITFDEEGFAENHSVVDILTKHGRRATEKIGRQATERGLEAETAVVQGAPAKEIRRYADENDIDLIAMGTRGRSGLSRYVLGSIAESVIRRAHQPILTAKSTAVKKTPTYDRILVPTDGSERAELVADYALDIAARYGARIYALSVIDDSLIHSPELLAALERESEAALQSMKARGSEDLVDVETSVWKGTPHDCIESFANEYDVDLIAIGAHRRRGLDRFLTRNVAERVVRRADCPVLTLLHATQDD